ncbi:hypothetical protein ACRCPS_17635 [Pseudomonas aeruginosa]
MTLSPTQSKKLAIAGAMLLALSYAPFEPIVMWAQQVVRASACWILLCVVLFGLVTPFLDRRARRETVLLVLRHNGLSLNGKHYAGGFSADARLLANTLAFRRTLDKAMEDLMEGRGLALKPCAEVVLPELHGLNDEGMEALERCLASNFLEVTFRPPVYRVPQGGIGAAAACSTQA